MMTALWWVGSVVIGVIAAWLAGRVMPGDGFGLPWNIAAGVLGAIAGGYLLRIAGMDLGNNLAGHLLVSFIAAVIVLFVVHILTGRRGGQRMWS
jgi:uncharacterized membrane protein YeaQ/YmgE (transglycosylase-associated protein family)